MKVLVLGASGMAGHVVSLYLRENGFSVDTLSAKHPLDKETFLVDATDTPKLKTFLRNSRYDAVINCIGVLVKQSETRKDLAVYINSYLPHFLERHYGSSNTKVIHISTDEVYSFNTPPYTETSSYDGESFYGRTKALGEIINDKDLTFRMSIVGPAFQADSKGLFNWFWAQSGEVPGYANGLWNGVTTIELAKAIKGAITQDLFGLYHLVPESGISKFDLLNLFKKEFGRDDITLKPAEGMALDKSLTNTRKDFHYQVPDYPAMVREMKQWVESHPAIYKHYAK